MKLGTEKNAINAQNLRVLVIDDARVSQHVIQQRLMDNGYHAISFAETAKQIRDHIKDFQPHVIILDWMMPNINGLSLTKMIRAQDQVKKTHTYVLMITGKDSEQAMIQAFSEGVDDFIAKADVASQLAPRMIRATAMLNHWHSYATRLEQLQEKLRHQQRLVTIDPVSLLPTRQGFRTYFHNALETATARNQGLVCLLVIISNYEKLKSTLPPKALERVLRLFAEKLTKLLRPTDFAARTEAGEFCILLQTAQDFAIPTLDRIERSLNQLSLKTKDGYHVLEIKTAGAQMLTEAFSEEWDEQDLRQYLSKIAMQTLPISNRVRRQWPEVSTKNQEVSDFLFAD